MDNFLKGAAMDDVLWRLVAIEDLVRTEMRKIREATHGLKFDKRVKTANSTMSDDEPAFVRMSAYMLQSSIGDEDNPKDEERVYLKTGCKKIPCRARNRCLFPAYVYSTFVQPRSQGGDRVSIEVKKGYRLDQPTKKEAKFPTWDNDLPRLLGGH